MILLMMHATLINMGRQIKAANAHGSDDHEHRNLSKKGAMGYLSRCMSERGLSLSLASPPRWAAV